MSLQELFDQTISGWMDGTGPSSDIVISSRIRLARNIEGLPLPHVLDAERAQAVIEKVERAVDDVNKRGNLGHLKMYLYKDISALERQILVEKHLVSPALGQGCPNCGAAVNKEGTVSILINEEDHLRLQCLQSGLQLEETWELCSALDDGLEEEIEYAFQEKYGYLTACPTNVGTGLRGSVMIHLPGLVMTGQVGRILNTVGQLGLAVRGFYGEGSEAAGNIFQLSNQITLGHEEEKMIENLESVTRQIFEQEQAAREALMSSAKTNMEDRVWRSYGVLTNARIVKSTEALQLLSDIRLGSELGVLPSIGTKTLNELLVIIRPAYLQWLAGSSLETEERDHMRAGIIREKLGKS